MAKLLGCHLQLPSRLRDLRRITWRRNARTTILREPPHPRVLQKDATSKLFLFQRLVHKIAISIKHDLRFQQSAIDALCESGEDYPLRGGRQGSETLGADCSRQYLQGRNLNACHC